MKKLLALFLFTFAAYAQPPRGSVIGPLVVNGTGGGAFVGEAAASSAPAVFTPATLGTKLKLWLDANDSATITKDGSNNVSHWGDKSLSAESCDQSTAASKPVWTASVRNALPALFFNATNPGQRVVCGSTTLFSPTTAYTIYVAFQAQTQPFSYGGLVTLKGPTASVVLAQNTTVTLSYASIGGGTNLTPGVTIVDTLNTFYIAKIFSSGAGTAVANFSAEKNLVTTTVSAFTNPLSAGGGDNSTIIGDARNPWFYPYKGYIFEVVLAAGLTASEETKMNTYLQVKYGL